MDINYTTDTELAPIVEAQLTDAELIRVVEIARTTTVAAVDVLGRDHEGILVVQADHSFAVNDQLYVLTDGRVAEADLNHPLYFPDFARLALAAGTR